jgi:hypothetical protein
LVWRLIEPPLSYFMFWLKKIENRMTTAQMANNQPTAMTAITLPSPASALSRSAAQANAGAA